MLGKLRGTNLSKVNALVQTAQPPEHLSISPLSYAAHSVRLVGLWAQPATAHRLRRPAFSAQGADSRLAERELEMPQAETPRSSALNPPFGPFGSFGQLRLGKVRREKATMGPLSKESGQRHVLDGLSHAETLSRWQIME